MKKYWRKSLGAAVLLLILLAAPGIGVAAAESEVDYGTYLETMMDYLNQRASEEHSEEQMAQDALRGIFERLDRFTYFTDKTDAENLTGEFDGIGVVTSMVDGYVFINSVLPGCPAEAAGVMTGDKVISVDGVYVVGEYSHEEVVAMMRGAKGTVVKLGVLRHGTETLEISITRDIIEIVPMSYELYEDVIYIYIEQFNPKIGESFSAALRAADEAGVSKVILDLRNNPGGELGAMMQVANELIPAGVVFTTEFRYDGYETKPFYSELQEPKYQLVVLVNGNSASCAEILAAAVQDRNAGTVIGTSTFGKYDLQIVTPILTAEAANRFAGLTGEWLVNATEVMTHGFVPQNSDIIGWLTLNCGWWLRSDGTRISRDGLTPDIVVEGDAAVIASVNNLEALTKEGKPGLGEESIEVYNAKKILNLAGYETGALSPVMDEQTFAAIKAFQADKGLYAYGVLDFSTQDALNRLRLELLEGMDPQYVKALEVLQ